MLMGYVNYIARKPDLLQFMRLKSLYKVFPDIASRSNLCTLRKSCPFEKLDYLCVPAYGFMVSLTPAPMASWRPMFPKHTQAQKMTLATQVRTAMLSCVMPAPIAFSHPVPFKNVVPTDGPVDAGIISGLNPRTALMPVMPTATDSRKPVEVRSIRYQRTGFARARVNEAWVVDCQGSRR